MRIALLTYSTRARGGVVHTLALAEALVRRGEEVTVVTLGRGGDTAFFRPVAAGVDIVVVPFAAGRPGEGVGERVQRSIAALAAGFDPSGFDVVHAEDCISANAFPGSIRTVHHIDHFETPELVRCHELGITGASAHVCVSEAVAAELVSEWSIQATVIPNGVDASRFARAAQPRAADARREWLQELGGPYVLTVGGIEPRKGSLQLADAWAAVRSRLRGMRLVIAGGETLFDYRDYRTEFDRRCQELGIEPLIVGAVAEDRLPALVAGASVFAFPSAKEGFGLAALEAAAAGVPLVVSDLPVFRQILGGGALFAPDPPALGRAILAAARSPDPTRLTIARSVAFSYSWDAAAASHVALYARWATARGDGL